VLRPVVASSTWIRPSTRKAAATVPSAEIAWPTVSGGRDVETCCTTPVVPEAFPARTVRSKPAPYTVRESGENATSLTAPEWPWSSSRRCSVRPSHTVTVPSALEAATLDPSGDQTASVSGAVLPLLTSRGAAPATSATRTRPSGCDTNTARPSGRTAAVRTTASRSTARGAPRGPTAPPAAPPGIGDDAEPAVARHVQPGRRRRLLRTGRARQHATVPGGDAPQDAVDAQRDHRPPLSGERRRRGRTGQHADRGLLRGEVHHDDLLVEALRGAVRSRRDADEHQRRAVGRDVERRAAEEDEPVDGPPACAVPPHVRGAPRSHRSDRTPVRADRDRLQSLLRRGMREASGLRCRAWSRVACEAADGSSSCAGLTHVGEPEQQSPGVLLHAGQGGVRPLGQSRDR
jgi:hypothetical protein